VDAWPSLLRSYWCKAGCTTYLKWFGPSLTLEFDNGIAAFCLLES
jgi:hypothetical protein